MKPILGLYASDPRDLSLIYRQEPRGTGRAQIKESSNHKKGRISVTRILLEEASGRVKWLDGTPIKND